MRGVIKTSVRGQKGNREFFVFWSLGGELLNPAEVQTLIEEVVWDEKN